MAEAEHAALAEQHVVERRTMIAMPIWLSMVCARLLVNTIGATASSSAKPPHTIQRPTL